jgi:hypothetical protein
MLKVAHNGLSHAGWNIWRLLAGRIGVDRQSTSEAV